MLQIEGRREGERERSEVSTVQEGGKLLFFARFSLISFKKMGPTTRFEDTGGTIHEHMVWFETKSHWAPAMAF